MKVFLSSLYRGGKEALTLIVGYLLLKVSVSVVFASATYQTIGGENEALSLTALVSMSLVLMAIGSRMMFSTLQLLIPAIIGDIQAIYLHIKKPT